MVDRLRLLWNRPLSDADRPRLFAIAVALIAGAAAVLTQIERPAPPPRAEQPQEPPAIASPTPEQPASPAPAGVQAQSSDEGERAPVIASRAAVRASKRAARRFLAGYLPYSYGRGRASAIDPATASLRRQLAAQRPRVPAAERRRTPRLTLLQSNTVSRDRAELVALVDDGRRRYTVALELGRAGGGWQVERAGS